MNPVAGPRPAATVALVRDGVEGGEAYRQRRPRTMWFAGGLWVFPGGRIDAADADPAVDAIWGGPPPAAWAERMGVTAEQARGFVVAACRETFEEAGVLLVDRPPDPLPLQAGRGALLAGERDLAAMLASMGVRLDTVAHTGGRASPLRHPLLRRGAARGCGGIGRGPGGGGTRAVAGAERGRGGPVDADAAADTLHPA